MATFAEGIRELAQTTNPTMLEIGSVAVRGTAVEAAKLHCATRQAFGGGIPWRDALRNEGLIPEEGEARCRR